MKSIEVSKSAFAYIEHARKGDDHEIVVTDIANSLSIIASLIQSGRDDDSINPWIDDLLKVMATIAEYNNLYNAIAETTDNKLSGFSFQNDEEDTDLEAIRKQNERLGSNISLWLTLNSPDETIEVLETLEDGATDEQKEILNGLYSMLNQIKKDVS